jgi:HEAT repeat protein
MEIKFNCPGCDQRLSIDETGAGSEVTCPNCSQSMTVPGLAPPPPPLRPPAAGWLPASRRARGWAITSFVLALIGLVPVLGLGTGLLGLVFGVVALVKGTTSRGLAIAGTAIGCVASLMIPLHLAMFGTTMAAAKFGAGTAQCTTNLRLVGEGISAYRGKHGGMYPPDLDELVREGIIAAGTLCCPLHEAGGGYLYSRPPGREARGIVAWDRHAHRAVGQSAPGRNVLDATLTVRFLTEQQFAVAPRAARMHEERAAGPGHGRPAPPAPPLVKEAMTVEGALAGLEKLSPAEKRQPLKFIASARPEEAQRGAVIAALRPLLNDVDCGDLAFQAFAKWAGSEEVPDLAEMVRVAPGSPRGREAMKLLSRSNDARAAAPLAECLADFHSLRDAKAALAALGGIAKPAVLPFYHHENGNSREAARELLRGYGATDEEILDESIRALEAGGAESRRSALEHLTAAKLPPAKQVEVARAVRPLVTDGDGRVSEGARNVMKAHATKADADFLLGLMDTTDRHTRQFAAELLIRFEDARVAVPLAVLLADQYESYWAGDQLIKLGKAAEPAVIPFLAQDDPMVRRRAADTLAKLGTRASLPGLEKLLDDKDFFARVAAENAIKAIKAREP